MTKPPFGCGRGPLSLVPLVPLVLFALGATPGLALPAGKPLAPGRVTVEAADCRLEIEIAPNARATVSASDARTGADLSTRLDVKTRDDESTVRLVPRGPEREERLVVKIVLRAGQRLQLGGTGLNVSIVGEPPQGAQPSASPIADPPLKLRLKKSVARISGLSGANVALSLTADSTDVHVEKSVTSVAATLTGGSLELLEHRGPALVNSSDAAVQLEGGAPQSTMKLIGGTLTVRDGSGPVTVSANRTVIHVDQWSGPVKLATTGGTAQVVRSTTNPVSLVMKDTNAQLLQGSGKADVKCDGGFLEVDGFAGPVTIKASNRATVAARDTTGPLGLTLVDGVRLDVRNASGAVTAGSRGSSVSIEKAASVKLDAADSEVTLRGVKRLLPLALRGCTGKIDLLETLGSLNISSTQGSRIDIEIPEPCEVRASGAGATLGSSIRCSGCDLKLPNHPNLGRPRQPIRGTRRAVLVLTVDEDSRVGIRGR